MRFPSCTSVRHDLMLLHLFLVLFFSLFCLFLPVWSSSLLSSISSSFNPITDSDSDRIGLSAESRKSCGSRGFWPLLSELQSLMNLRGAEMTASSRFLLLHIQQWRRSGERSSFKYKPDESQVIAAVNQELSWCLQNHFKTVSAGLWLKPQFKKRKLS